jgi:predicted O-linked N-acetylglucosamine transferase (SPINDLY family)
VKHPLDSARADLRAGRLPEARRELEDLLRQRPDDPATLQLMASLAYRFGDLRGARALLERAVARAPDDGPLHAQLAEARRSTGDLAAAEAVARRAVELAPALPAALNNLALVLQDQGRLAEAEDALRRAIAVDHAYPRAHYNLGNVLRAAGRPQEAAASLRTALALQPEYPQALNSLGVVLGELGQPEAAEERLLAASRLSPLAAKPLLNLAALHRKRERPHEALACYEQALRLAPDSPAAASGRAEILAGLGRADDAIALLEQTVRRGAHATATRGTLTPALRAQALAQLAGLYQARFDFALAERTFARAVELDGSCDEAVAGIVGCRAQLCDWRQRATDIARLRDVSSARLAAGRPSPVSVSLATILGWSAAEHLEIARDTAARLSDRTASSGSALPPRPAPERSGRLRLGYLASDFRDHALAHLTRRMYGLHDRARFEVHGYSLGPDDGSEYRQGIADDCDRFVDLAGVSPEAAARRIREDGIDVLVDLTGLAAGSRPEILARRPAPVQVAYLYPSTLGGVLTDYLIGDPIVTPLEHQPFFGESLALLPHSYQVNDHRQPIASRRFEREAQGLPSRAFVFCSFNNHWKIEPAIWDVWMRILERVPRGVLWLQDMAGGARVNLRREAEVRGVRGDRLIFAPHLPKADHLARCGLADLFLDTRICNAHTTASDALWSGVPVLTCLGEHLPARVAASLLTAVGLPELIVRGRTGADLAAYEAVAVDLALDPERLRALRSRLVEQRHTGPLFDTARTVRNLERAYLAMWRRHQAGDAPAPFQVDETMEPQP